MDKYWLYLDAYTFIFEGENRYLIYNSFSGHSFEQKKQPTLDAMINDLRTTSNMYCIGVDNKTIKKTEIKHFIQKLKNTFSGDLVKQTISNGKPAILYPKLNLQRGIERLKKDIARSVGEEMMQYLTEFSFYINSVCENNCSNCKTLCNQTLHCTKFNDELNYSDIKLLFEEMKGSNLVLINILGGNILKYPDIMKLKDYLNSRDAYKRYFLHYKHLNQDAFSFGNSEFINTTFSILINGTFNKTILAEKLKFIHKTEVKYELLFTISNEEEYMRIEDFCNINNITGYQLLPYFNQNNLSFFKENVFVRKDDILSSSLSRRNIYAHQALNKNDFGKLTILPNGDVYANLNHDKLGNIKNNSIYQIVYAELLTGRSWLRIRDQKPCCNCVYQWLCPSPSNYELVNSKPNLCHLEN